jgi:hypothetical protein
VAALAAARARARTANEMRFMGPALRKEWGVENTVSRKNSLPMSPHYDFDARRFQKVGFDAPFD